MHHQGDLAHSDVQYAAVKLNMPLIVSETDETENAGSFAKESFVHTDCEGVLIDTVKQSEDGKAAVIRVYEYRNRKVSSNLIFGRPVKQVMETDLCEENGKEVPISDNRVSFTIGNFEIKTFKVYF